ncbi:hypothetical protein SADUNF_Sadunf04G0023000 [Salix dunnii]|uniref:Uncharacterized protein n=1 Tax=Salix dunnii TaxID=1413687 RepID=A0A835MYH1_9ROSI|nr:hypothetical protein SADUNF_Sadunf04G0023000 [Salix dunnii]
MTSFRSWKLLRRNTFCDGVKSGLKMKQLPFMGVICTVMLFVVYRTTVYQYQHTEMDENFYPFKTLKDSSLSSGLLGGLPHGIIQASSDLELKPLWSTSSSRSKVGFLSSGIVPSILGSRACLTYHGNQMQVEPSTRGCLLAIPVGIKQKDDVDHIVQKFLPENFTVMLFHYDGNVDGWWDLDWSDEAIHIVAKNQTKWWFAKRFLHPAVVSAYDYIFLWDEDLGVEHFNPGRYLKIVRFEGLEISQPALDPNSTNIHHRITMRARMNKFHRRVYNSRGRTKCSDISEGPPCTGFVEGMAPVFSRSAWYCAWHLIQNDLVHGWGMDMKLGYCAQGDRTKKVGVIDSEYILHKGIQTLGGRKPPERKASNTEEMAKRHRTASLDPRMEIRRQSSWELQIFRDRWQQAVKEDKNWVDPFLRSLKHRKLKRHG